MKPAARSFFKRIAITTFATGSIILTGCQSAEQAADSSAQEQYADAQQAADTGQLEKAITAIDSIGANTDLSAFKSTEVHALQGHVHLVKANDLLEQAAVVDLNISRILGELRLSTAHVQSIQSQVKSDLGYEPGGSITELKTQIAKATGSPTELNWQGDLLTLAGVDAKSATLNQAISDNREHAAALDTQKKTLSEQADALQQKSLNEPGRQSVDDVTAAADLSRRAAEAGIASEQLDAALVHLKADLAQVQGQRPGIQKAIDEFNKQISEMELAWKAVQQDIEAQQRAVATMAGPAQSPPAGDQADDALPRPTTIADQCTQLKSLIAASRTLRDQAAKELTTSIQAYHKAAKAGEQVRQSFNMLNDHTTPGEKASIQRLEETYAGASYGLAAAEAQRVLATNYSSEALIALQARQALSAALASLGSGAPPAIADCQTAIATPSVDDLTQLAEDQFKELFDNYDGLAVQSLPGAATNSRKIAAKVGKMIAVYSAKQLSLALQNKPIAGQTPKELQDTIDGLAKEVSDDDVTRLPAIPFTIAPPPAPTTMPN
jgi:chromosome segregation ATPase